MIRLANVSKYYHSQNGVALGLRKIDLEFRKKEFIAITGESGSGKSTLLNVLSGSDTYEEGEMYFNGEGTSHYTKEEWEEYRKNNVAFIYQGYNLIDSYTVLENVQTAILIREDYDSVEDKAFEYLEKVGLDHLADNKAVHLSSGQKQRLAIARALAKETEIIVADEPTGNLDRENGEQVMEILAELSKEKMVIVVTHNYDQAMPYATRKIRMYSGEVAEDMDVVRTEDGSYRENAHANLGYDIDESEPEKKSILNEHVGYTKADFRRQKYNMAWRFVSMNRKSQPKKNIFMFLFFLFISFAFYIMLGGFFGSIDNATSKFYSDAAFKNGNTKRIVVRHFDNSVVTQNDLDKILSISKVEEADLYDSINDFNFFCERDVDYRIVYDKCEEPGYDDPDKTYIEMLDFSKFMRSSLCLTQDDLAEGELPTNFNEVVIYSKDTSLIGQTKVFYISDQNNWGKSQYMELSLKVTGILKYPTDQAYFSELLCRYLSVNIQDLNSEWYVMYGGNGRGVTSQSSGMSTSNTGGSIKYVDVIFKPNESLTESDVNLSSLFYDTAVKFQGYQRVQKTICRDTIFKYTDANGEVQSMKLNLTKTESGSGNNVVEISFELFDKLFPKLDSTQVSVYIQDYAYTDRVIKALTDAGYDAISVYRVGATTYDMEAVMENVRMMAICAAALIFIFFLGWMLIYTLLKLKKGDFIIFKSIGMSQDMVHRIVWMDVMSNFAMAAVSSVALTYILSWCDIEYMFNIIKYYNIFYYAVYVLAVWALAKLIIGGYSKYIKKKDSIIDLRAE